MNSRTVTIHTSGAACGNPGSAGIGLVITQSSGKVTLVSENIGIATTVQAQYQAILMAVTWAIEHKYDAVTVYVDNAKIIRSLLHNPTVSDLNIIGLHKRVRRLARSIKVNYALFDNTVPHKVSTLALEASFREENSDTAPENPSGKKSVSPPDGGLHKRHALQQSAGGVLYKEDKDGVKICLISKKDGAVWALPKGRIQSGETWEETAIREVLEETGHLATIADRLDQIEYVFYWQDNHTLYYKLVFFFLMPLIKENAAPRDSEACETAWFTLGEALNKLYYQSEKGVLLKAKELLRAAGLIK
ncbi:NUDIX domain-containing protein [bacterium]|nr:NUDIX domain-containing protein [bacterium]